MYHNAIGGAMMIMGYKPLHTAKCNHHITPLLANEAQTRRYLMNQIVEITCPVVEKLWYISNTVLSCEKHMKPSKHSSQNQIPIVNETDEPVYSEEGVDLTLIRWMLSLSPKERLLHLQKQINMLNRIRNARKRR